MDQQGNDFSNKITKIFSTEDTKVVGYSISVQSNHIDFHHMGGFASSYMMGSPSGELSLTFKFKNTSDYRVEAEAVELSLALILLKMNGHFLARNITHDVMTYRLKLGNYDFFLEELDKMFLEKMDEEFTKALEEKLQED